MSPLLEFRRGTKPELVFMPIFFYALVMVTRRLNEIFEDRPFSLLTAAVTKLGRTHMVVAYIKPESPVAGEAVDALWEAMQTRLQEVVGPVKSEIVITGKSPYA